MVSNTKEPTWQTASVQMFLFKRQTQRTHDGPLVKDGRIQIPDKPGLGVEPNPDYVRAHLAPGEIWWG
jgi:L-alanine-DL-glutamate epimerase-like enolase superfamily enzyme